MRLTRIEFFTYTIKGDLVLIPKPLVDAMERMLSFPDRHAFSIAEIFIKWQRVLKNRSNFKSRILTYHGDKYILKEDLQAMSHFRLASRLYEMALELKAGNKSRASIYKV